MAFDWDAHLIPSDPPEDPREYECSDMHEAFDVDMPPGMWDIIERCKQCFMRQWCETGREAYKVKIDAYWEDKALEREAVDHVLMQEEDLRYAVEDGAEIELTAHGYCIHRRPHIYVSCEFCHVWIDENELPEGADVDFTTEDYMGSEADVLIFFCPKCGKRTRSYRMGR